MPYNIKQILVIRKDLKMRKGKEYSQLAHASLAFIGRQIQGKPLTADGVVVLRLTDVEKTWFDESFAKICLQVNSEEELLAIEAKAKEVGVMCHLITDSGATEFKEPTRTCLALGPDLSEKIDEITGHLKLY